MLILTADAVENLSNIKNISESKITESKLLIDLCKKIKESFNFEIKLSNNKKDTTDIVSKLHMFSEKINESNDNLFKKQIDKFEKFYSIELKIKKSTILIHILCDKVNNRYISYILHAINTFCTAFEADYNGLHIYISLDDNKRDLSLDENEDDLSLDKIFELNKRMSTAFNVSGVTMRSKKIIILTKKQEMIKLLFHELIHFIGLDENFVGENTTVNWAIKNKKLNISEAYTEYLSIIIHSIYISIHLNKNIIDVIEKEISYGYYLMSVYLKFYGYNKNNFTDFFLKNEKNAYSSNDKIAFSPIATFEYVFLRCLFFHYNLLSKIKNISVTSYDINLINNMIIDENFIDRINKSFTNKSVKKLNYILFDLDDEINSIK